MLEYDETNFNSIKVRLEPERSQLPLKLFRFQFHKGTIRTLFTRLKRAKEGNFNSIKVRLEPCRDSLAIVLLGFQFHKGTIRTIVNPSKSESVVISIP